MRLIDADALKEVFAKHEDRKGYLIGDWEDLIDDAPTVSTYTFKEVDEIRQTAIEQTRISCKRELLRPTGHWVNGYKSFNCSVCGKIAYSWNHFGEYIQVKSNFCPNCGADMRKEAEND